MKASMKTTLLLALMGYCSIAHAVTVNISVSQYPLCNYPVGELSASAFGGVGPYTYLWSTGATSPSITGLVPGTYSVTVTDANLDQSADEVELASVSFDHWSYGQFAPEPHCSGVWPFATFFRVSPLWTTGFFPPPPYYQNGEQMSQEPNGNPDVYYGVVPVAPGEEYTFTFSDANGCSAEITSTAMPAVDWPSISILDIEGSCSSYPTGIVTFAHGAEGFGRSVTYELTGLDGQGGDVLPGMVWYGSNAGTQVINDLPVGNYRLRQRTTGLYNASCYDEHLFTIPDLGSDCGLVNVRAFMDYNLNCTRQGSEPYVSGGIVEILPGPIYATTSEQGQFAVALPVGNYTLEQQSTLLMEHCTGGPIPFAITANTTTTVNLPDTSTVPLDVRAMLSSGIARPGFEFQYAINVRNLTPLASGATSLTFTFDPTLGYLSATPAPSSVSGNTITWNQTQLTAFQQRNYTIRFQVPPVIDLLGYELVATANIATANTDGNLANNTATNLRTITGAYDPNDKLAITSSGSTEVWDVNADEWIDYTIRFQNTGTDTALTVVITDTLPGNLDPGSILVGASSHSCTWELRDQGTLKFYLPNILLPDSNVNEPRSHGFVSFRIKPRLPVLPGSTIENTANIFFDFNDPVITEPSVLVAEFSTGVEEQVSSAISLAPVPASDVLIVTSSDAMANVRILAADGREVMRMSARSTHLRIDLNELKSGAYLLIAQLKNGTTAHGRFIKH